MKARVNVEDGSNLTEISPVLTCIHTLNDSSDLWGEEDKKFNSLSLKQLKKENDITKKDGFLFVVSLRDGSCLYTSDSITDHLGYPQDMLDGQCFMNFLFQKDRITLANHLTQGLNACFIQGKDNSHLVLNTFFCRIRQYHSLKQGYSVSDRKTRYIPFKITLHIKELVVDDLCVETSLSTLAVKASAIHVSSAYSVAEEIPAMTSFSTRHTASCHFSHVDASAIPYFGYLPQDMIGYSVFGFYHVDDLPYMKEIYELVVQEQGSSFRSKPYRFKIQNGCYIMLETEWSSFINPWSHKLEFVIGHHRVLKGPSDIDIFVPSAFEEQTIPEEILKESIVIQKEIKTLLAQSIQPYEATKSKRFCNKRKRDLAAFVYSCIDESLKNKGKAEKQFNLVDDRSHSDPDSVVMGDISPYRELNDSSVSSKTPPTVQQIRYQENIERFFASQPKTYSDGSEESTKHEKPSSVEDSQGSSSGSGNGSGNTSDSKGVQSSQMASMKNFDSADQKLSGSNSSKGNNSFAGDSGYGKSVEPNQDMSQAGSSNQMWAQSSQSGSANATTTAAKFSPCLALTEESLSVHNRMNHKQLKQRKGKGHSNRDPTWLQQKDAAKKKSVHTQTLIAGLGQDVLKNITGAEHTSLDYRSGQKAAPRASTANNWPSHYSPIPTPFYIPVMYMGTMPYYPPGPNSQPTWPFGPTSTSVGTSLKPAVGQDFQIPACSTQFFPGSDNMNNLTPAAKASGISTSTTTTSITTQTAQMFKDTSKERALGSLVASRRLDVKSDQADCDMLVDESQSSSFTRSSSCQSGDKSDDAESPAKRSFTRARSDKLELPADIAFRYQLGSLGIDDVLRKDREMLQSMHQPELVNEQLHVLQGEREAENKLKVDEEDFCMTEEVMLGLATEDDVNEELEYREERLLQFMCEDA